MEINVEQRGHVLCLSDEVLCLSGEETFLMKHCDLNFVPRSQLVTCFLLLESHACAALRAARSLQLPEVGDCQAELRLPALPRLPPARLQKLQLTSSVLFANGQLLPVRLTPARGVGSRLQRRS